MANKPIIDQTAGYLSIPESCVDGSIHVTSIWSGSNKGRVLLLKGNVSPDGEEECDELCQPANECKCYWLCSSVLIYTIYSSDNVTLSMSSTESQAVTIQMIWANSYDGQVSISAETTIPSCYLIPTLSPSYSTPTLSPSYSTPTLSPISLPEAGRLLASYTEKNMQVSNKSCTLDGDITESCGVNASFSNTLNAGDIYCYDKELTHVPTLVQHENGSYTFLVSNHPARKEHWIHYLWIVDHERRVLWSWSLDQPSEEYFVYHTFEMDAKITYNARELRPIIACNLHGVWEGEPIGIPQMNISELIESNAIVSNTSCIVNETPDNQFGNRVIFNETVYAGELCHAHVHEHIPQLLIGINEESGYTIFAPYRSSEKHWIQYVILVDEELEVLDWKYLSEPENDAENDDFLLEHFAIDASNSKSVIPLVYCAYHGLWMGSAVPTNPPTIEEYIGHNVLISTSSCLSQETHSDVYGVQEIFTSGVVASESCSDTEESHVPTLLDHQDGTYTFKIPHKMLHNHWIEWMLVRDEKSGAILWNQSNTQPMKGDEDYGIERIEVTFRPELEIRDEMILVPYQYCNLHGLWKGNVEADPIPLPFHLQALQSSLFLQSVILWCLICFVVLVHMLSPYFGRPDWKRFFQVGIFVGAVLSMWDFWTDIQMVYMLFKDNDFLWKYALTTIIIPIILNAMIIGYFIKKQSNKIVTKETLSIVIDFGQNVFAESFKNDDTDTIYGKHWFATYLNRNRAMIILVLIFTGVNPGAFQVCWSACFHNWRFACPISQSMEEKFHGSFLLPTVLLENIPQLLIQYVYINNNELNVVVLMSLVATCLMILVTLLTIVTSHFFLRHKQMVLKHVAERYIIFGVQVMMKQNEIINTAFELALNRFHNPLMFGSTKDIPWIHDRDYTVTEQGPDHVKRIYSLPILKPATTEEAIATAETPIIKRMARTVFQSQTEPASNSKGTKEFRALDCMGFDLDDSSG